MNTLMEGNLEALEGKYRFNGVEGGHTAYPDNIHHVEIEHVQDATMNVAYLDEDDQLLGEEPIRYGFVVAALDGGEGYDHEDAHLFV